MAPRKKAADPGLFDSEASSVQAPAPAPKSRRRATAAAPEIDARLATALEKLPALVERFEELLADIPRAAEFEPLAEHIYSFAQSGPKLMESLEAVKDAVPQIESATSALGETATTLQDTNQRLTDSLMRLPAADDYEPLAAPLVEFTRVSPALTESLREAMLSFAGVSQITKRLEVISKAMKPADGVPVAPASAPAPAPPAAPPATSPRATAQVAESLDTLANEIDAALEKIPKDPEYGRVADQLRELATVSPSLMEWLREVKPLAPPLAGSVLTLRRVAGSLRDNAALLRGEKTR